MTIVKRPFFTRVQVRWATAYNSSYALWCSQSRLLCLRISSKRIGNVFAQNDTTHYLVIMLWLGALMGAEEQSKIIGGR